MTAAGTTPGGGLSPEQLAKFNSDGYLIIPGALAPTTVSALLAETHKMLAEFPIETHPLTRFTTGGAAGDAAHVGDDYFLGSGDKIRFFFEEDAFDAAGALAKPKEKAINKIGHYLHGLSAPFAALLDDDAIRAAAAPVVVSPAAVARSLGFRDPRCLQSMVICKQPEIGGAVPPHQDSTFLYTSRPSAVGFWYALEDATLENGCLSFLPGSHRWAPVARRLVRTAAGAGTEMVDNDGPRFPEGDGYGEAGAPAGGARDDLYVPGEVRAGDLVLIHGNLLHKSERNTSQKGRIIYTFHVIEGQDREYDERNWLQPPKEGFTKLYV
ncbi:phytanoyl-dioxygenase family [Cordyceps militaris]|uniref:Phytanoyl-dioxygenase family n=1 Tax=Cordyceps militaris TaxID=73501 RepID=A0A2H4SR39_CORMI|nr:phytanoyl-dioxygenase family [Cordyceps militaris]